jgi:hypothetical protein
LLTTYFNSKPHPLYEHTVEKNSIAYIAPWYRSVDRLGLRGVIFHDGLSEEFIETYSTSKIEFVFVDPAQFEYSVNDQRYLVYDHYLRAHPTIDKVFMTDASDVFVVQDPFAFVAPGLVYVGNQPGRLHPPEPAGDSLESFSYSFIRERLEAAGSQYLALLDDLGSRSIRSEHPVLNAGILGGCRTVMLELLKAFREVFLAISQPQENLNMGVLNYVIYRDSSFEFVTGVPVHSQFGKYENKRKDVWFIHK